MDEKLYKAGWGQGSKTLERFQKAFNKSKPITEEEEKEYQEEQEEEEEKEDPKTSWQAWGRLKKKSNL
jgi:hypothetical protein